MTDFTGIAFSPFAWVRIATAKAATVMKPRRVLVLSIIVLGCVLLEGGPGRSMADEPPYPPSPIIAGYSLDWTTYRRQAPGSDRLTTKADK